MIIPAVPTDDRYSGGDPYAAADQYGSSGLNGSRYGDQYGTGSYSEYSTERGRYTTTIEIAGYDTGESGTGYGYTASEADTGYGTISTDSYRYGDSQETLSSDATLDYVVDILDGDVEIRSDSVALYVPLDIST